MVIAALLRRLGEILVQERLTTPDVVEEALARAKTTGERLGEALVALGAVKSEEVLRALAQQQNLAYLSRDELPSPLPIVKNLSAKYLRQYAVCPVSVENGQLTVATADPLNPVVVDDLRQFTGLAVKLVVSSAEAITEAIDRTYDGAATPLQRIVEGMEDERKGEGEEDVNQLRDMAFEAPVVRLVNLLIENAIAAQASDIHIEPFEDTLRIRYRLDGILFDQEAPPRRLQAAVTSRIKLMAEMNIAERRLPQDGRIRVTVPGRRVDIRVSTIPTVHGESIVMRLLDRSSVFLALEKLGFAPGTLRHFESLIKRPHGIVLVTGPTGSGKTTTLYGALDKINLPDRKIITVEDPVEYQLKGVNQIPVKPKIGLTFATGLRHIVRQDPDVILIGEIRDLETAEIAIQAALTGHLVFSTLHTNDAPGAITRLQDMGVEAYLVASVLEGVLAQRLVRRICTACRVPDTPSAADLEALGIEGAADRQLYRGRGCAERARWLAFGVSARVGQRDLLALTQQLATLVESALPLDRALAIQEELAPNPRVKAIVGDLLNSVRGGSSLSEALAKHHPRPFSRLYINMVRAGEKGGVLEVTLRRLAEFLETRAAFTDALVSALAYPLVIFSVGIGAIVFLMTFVIPRFATIFADLGQAVPLPTQILLSVSAGFQHYWWVLLLAILATVLAWRVSTGTPEGRLAWDQPVLRLPLNGRLAMRVETARFARTLGTMLKSGVPVMGALAVVGDMMTNQAIGRAIGRLADGVTRGGTIAAGMQAEGKFPALAVHMVRVGEETGRLAVMLRKVADTFENDVRIELKRVLGLLEPAIILGMGVLVAFIVVAMLLAIFSINEIPL